MAPARPAALLLCAWCGLTAAARAGGAAAGARPVALSLRRHQSGGTRAAARAAPPTRPEYYWQPTDFMLRGCMSVPGMPLEPVLEERLGMTVNRCFAFCSLKRGMGFFAIAGGSKCSCGPVYEGTKVEAGDCNTTCSGDDAPGCGGPMGASGTYADVYVMFDCAENTKEEEELIKQEKHEDMLAAYSSFPGQSCGQALGNKVEVGPQINQDKPSSTYIGPPEHCMSICMGGRGSEHCHGFTYDEVLQKCTFHSDVLDGPVEKAEGKECYFKKLGLLQAAPSRNATGNRTGSPRRCRAWSSAMSEASPALPMAAAKGPAGTPAQ